MSEAETSAAEGTAERAQSRNWLRRLALTPVVLILLIGLYYLVGMAYMHHVDDDPEFAIETSAPEGGSRSVAAAADMIDREINVNRWIANDPFFMPGWMLDNMPNFQIGMKEAVSRFAIELRDQIARRRGSSSADPNLQTAAGDLNYAPDVWIYDISTSFLPQRPTEQLYRQAMENLREYNDRLANGQAIFDKRADNLLAALERFASDIGGLGASSYDYLEENGGAIIDFYADDVFYTNKGRVYAYYILLRELGVDFQDVIAENAASDVWNGLIVSMRDAAMLHPWIVSNGAVDGQFRPNHLAAQGFLMLRARTQLKEVIDILTK